MIIDPVAGFLIVWLFTGSVLAYLFKLVKLNDLNDVVAAYIIALIPALIVAVQLSK